MPDKNKTPDWAKAEQALAALLDLKPELESITPDDRKTLSRAKDILHNMAGLAEAEAEKACEAALGTVRYPVPDGARLIWSDMSPQCDPACDDEIAKFPLADQDLLDAMLSDHPNTWKGDEAANLGDNPVDVMLIVDAGRWNGRLSGYQIFEGVPLSKAVLDLSRGRDHIEYTAYAQGGEIKIKAVHHDAADYFVVQEITDMPGLHDALEREDRDAVRACLAPLYPRVAKVYGWPDETPRVPAWPAG